MTHPFVNLRDNQWVRPVRSGWTCVCCQCGLRHKLDFKLVKVGRVRHIEFRARRGRKA